MSGDSPLKLFGEAKENINNIFVKLENCVDKAAKFYKENQSDPEISQHDLSLKQDTEKLFGLKDSIKSIMCVLSRNQMKVAFFGRTSNGKSTVINAILHDRVLPAGYGHTTGCFLQIEGSDTDEKYFEIIKDGKTIDRKPLQSIEHDVNALNSNSLKHSSLVKIHWPISLCPLLKYDVVFVDSPGVDVEDDLDEWIDQHCKDADVFVLVSNSESTLNNAEKKFFHKVKAKLSKPNIFILNNRWDSIADDPKSMDQVKSQHVKRAIDFLSVELDIKMPHEEAKKRIFFVSARETLMARAPDLNGSFNDNKRLGYEERAQEFINFERKFEESLSKSAVQTKFENHKDRGLATLKDLKRILEGTRTSFKTLLQSKETEKQSNISRLTQCESFYSKLDNTSEDIKQMNAKILMSINDVFDIEIRHLSRIIEDFEPKMKFSPNRDILDRYKQQLYLHVERNLGDNLQNRINSVIITGTKPIKLFCDNCQTMSEDRQKIIKDMINSESFVPAFNLSNYRQFYTGFQEDLEFRFSFGTSRILRFLQSRFPFLQSSSLDPNADGDFLVMAERFITSSPQSPSMVGALAIGGILVRTVGWRTIAVGAVLYGTLYGYEYLTWTNSAKERTFKAQYTKYAKKGLSSVSQSITMQLGESVQTKTNNVFEKFKSELDAEKSQIQVKVDVLGGLIGRLQRYEQIAAQLCGQSDVLMTELVNFAQVFLTA